jgi:hypothetical protein
VVETEAKGTLKEKWSETAKADFKFGAKNGNVYRSKCLEEIYEEDFLHKFRED